MGTPIAFMSGTTNGFSVGATKRATIGLNTGTSLVSGNNWWNGVDVSSQYLLYSDQFSQGQSVIPTSRPTAWSTPTITDQNLLNLINTLPDRVGLTPFVNINVALQWLQNSQKYLLIKNGYENIVTDGLVLNLDAGWANSYPGTGTVWTDLSGQGNNTTLYNGPTLQSVGLGSLYFDGADDYAVSSTSSAPGTGDFAISVWVYLSNNYTNRYLWDFGANGGTLSYGTEIGGRGFRYYNPTIGVTNLYNNGVIPSTNTWYNVIISRISSVTTMYTNGVFTASAVDNGNISQTPLNIGRYGGGGYLLYGNLGNFLYYRNKGLTAAEVQQNYDVQKSRFGYWGQTLWSGNTQYYDFSKGQSYPGTGTAITDLSGNGYNGSTVGGSFTTISGVKCWDCTANGHVLTDTDFTYGNNYTILIWAWALADSQVSTWRTLLRTVDDDHPLIIQDGTDLIGYYDNNAGGFVSYGITLASTGLANNWGLYTLVGTSGTSQKLYINDGTTNATVNYNVTGENQDAWGNAQGGTQDFGYVSSMVVYNNQAFTQAQVAQYFNATKQYFGYAPNNTISYGLVMSLDAGQAISYPGSGTIWYDLSPNGFNNTLYNGPTYSSSYGGTINFDATDDYTSPGSLGGGFSTFTVEIWFKSDSVSNYRNPIDCNYLIENGSYSNLGPRLEQDSAGKLVWFVGSGNDVYSFVNLVGSGMSSTPYHYAAITKTSSSNFNGYYNGNYTSNLSLSNWPGSMLNVNLGRGFSMSSERYFLGNIPVVRIYNRALSAAEIKQNYNAQKARFGL